jgi:predicted glutamine amidotransferase
MCRFLAYLGTPIFIADLVCTPGHSLVRQSLRCAEGKATTNGDGFGLGWYAERPEPGLYREIRPAWSDENLASLCAQVRSRLFFAHVRASTGTATTRANCHPFASGRHMFMHNGQIGDFTRIRRRIEDLIPDALYDDRLGTSDTEALFLAALAEGLDVTPIEAMARTLGQVRGIMLRAGIEAPLRIAAAYTDGEGLHAFRWASDAQAPSLYWRRDDVGLVLASEPFDDRQRGWREMPQGSALVACPGQEVAVQHFAPEGQPAAA